MATLLVIRLSYEMDHDTVKLILEWKVDAEKIARYGRPDPEMLRLISHRKVAQQETLALIGARDVLVRLRTGAVKSVRGLAKPCGYRLPASSIVTFAKRCLAVLPPGLAQALGALLQQIADTTVKTVSLTCPHCKAMPGKDCRTISGGLTAVHLERVNAAAAKDEAVAATKRKN